MLKTYNKQVDTLMGHNIKYSKDDGSPVTLGIPSKPVKFAMDLIEISQTYNRQVDESMGRNVKHSKHDGALLPHCTLYRQLAAV